jgi:undecaprenyl diphosphate synthase
VDNRGLTCAIALSYGGKQDILQATQQVAALVAQGALAPGDVTEELFQSLLLSHGACSPFGAPDLLIRCAARPLCVNACGANGSGDTS